MQSRFSVADRLKFWLVSLLSYWIIQIIGRTLRYEVRGWENYEAIRAANKRIIHAFWHGRIFPGTYFFRNRGIVVMTSRNKDGEYIARVIRRLGYGAARGSSSRGGRRALVEMMHELQDNRDVAFTLDGPRGPRYIAKPGAIWLAARTGHAIMPFHLAPEKSWVFQSWDRFHIPKPFSRVLLEIAPAIYVKPDATAQEMEELHQKLQLVMTDLLRRGNSHWSLTEQK
jgi:lysophospholipid acyltransferase (LPLAT)-like uncharacterized protein